MRASRIILASLAITVIVNLWGFAYITLVPVIGEGQLGLSPINDRHARLDRGAGRADRRGSGRALRPAARTTPASTCYSSAVFLLVLIGIGLSTSPVSVLRR